jgi:hypothetical protein
MEGKMTTKSQWICNKGNGGFGIGNCSSHRTHNLGVASYVPHHDNCSTSQTIIPPVLLTHDKQVVDTTVVTICNMEKTNPLWPTPFIVMLLKTFMFAQRSRQALVDPIKVGSRGNIFEWMQVGFNVHF